MRTRTVLCAAALLLAVAGCGGAGGEVSGGAGGPGDEGEPSGGWVLAEGEHDGEAVPIVEDADITLNVEEGRWGGTAACNSYGARVTVDGDRVEIADLAVTEMACMPEEVMASETAYLAAFGSVERYDERDARLVLEGEGVRLTYDRVPETPDAEMTGTTWHLESVVADAGPDGAVSSVQGETTLRLTDDGTFVVGGDCLEVTGTWQSDDEGVRFLDVDEHTDDCPPELEGQVRRVSEVLTGRATAEIDGDRLVLTGPDGSGLDLRAR